MSRMNWCGKDLHEMTDHDLLVARRDITDCRSAVALKFGEQLAEEYDGDLEELAAEIIERPGLSEQPALPQSGPEGWLNVRLVAQ